MKIWLSLALNVRKLTDRARMLSSERMPRRLAYYDCNPEPGFVPSARFCDAVPLTWNLPLGTTLEASANPEKCAHPVKHYQRCSGSGDLRSVDGAINSGIITADFYDHRREGPRRTIWSGGLPAPIVFSRPGLTGTPKAADMYENKGDAAL
jgi:hypothetical protein